jgi:hypothetical protein
MVILVQNVNIVSRRKRKVTKKNFCFQSLVSDCISSSCGNNAQCISSTSNCSLTTCSASCICLSNTTGTYCEQQSISCLIHPCLNGGTCLINPITNTYYCQCPSNTTGTR